MHSAVPCPFCGLLCDDLRIETQTGGTLRVAANGCPRAVAGFERKPTDAAPRLRGKEATATQAYRHIAARLGAARFPLFAGLGTDVDGLRSVMRLADRCGGVVDHMHGEVQARNLCVLQDSGWITTTLAEVKNRADFLLFVGSDGVYDHPRFFERIVWSADSLFGLKPEQRTLVYLGADLDTKPGRSPAGLKPLVLQCPQEACAEVILALRSLLAGRGLRAATVGGVKTTRLVSLVEQMKKARYGVILWSAAQLGFAHADLTVQAIVDLIRDLNQATRYAGVPLGGNDGGASASSVCAWQSGFPLPTSFASGVPEHERHRYSAARLIEQQAPDLLLWISAFRAVPPPVTKIPSIVLGTPDLRLAAEPEVFVPVATPGVDHAGRLVRCDSVLSLPLRALRGTSLPSVAQVLDAVEPLL
ncbi:MAG: formylmethanofuran dehydrogenase [Gammaproteobacteria bacterium]